MPYKSKTKNREYNKQLLRQKRDKIYRERDSLSVVVPQFQIKYKDGTNSQFTLTPIYLSKNDKVTLTKIITNQFI